MRDTETIYDRFCLCFFIKTTSSVSATKYIFNLYKSIAEPPSPTGEGFSLCEFVIYNFSNFSFVFEINKKYIAYFVPSPVGEGVVPPTMFN